MKPITCAAAGGSATCITMLTGNTAKEMVADGIKHVTEAHPEMAADIQKMSSGDTAKWMADFHAKFDALPEEPAA